MVQVGQCVVEEKSLLRDNIASLSLVQTESLFKETGQTLMMILVGVFVVVVDATLQGVEGFSFDCFQKIRLLTDRNLSL